jgi:hypothetical protein
VPPASSFAAISFAASVEGYARSVGGGDTLRVVMHRLMSFEGQDYFQQLSWYLGPKPDPKGAGRIFEVSTGVIGEAWLKKKILRTRSYSDDAEFMDALQKSMNETGDTRSISAVALSYLAVPILGPDGDAVLVLYADNRHRNFFADDVNVKTIVAMSEGFCRAFDDLEENPLPHLRNYPVARAEPALGARGVYRHIQEELDDPRPPQFKRVSSFNYEFSQT